MAQPANVATPAVTVLLSPPVQVSVPEGPLVGVPGLMDSVTTVVLSDGTVLPLLSTTRTVGCVDIAVPPVTSLGGVCGHPTAVPQQIFTALAMPEVTLKTTPPLSGTPLADAVRWYPVSMTVSVQPANVA